MRRYYLFYFLIANSLIMLRKGVLILRKGFVILSKAKDRLKLRKILRYAQDDKPFVQNAKTFFLLIFACITLTSCGHVQDGPPSFYVDETRIPNAVPKPEPLSRLGNKPYYVFGKRYYVLPSSQNYTAIGTASWYGTKFDSHRTSNGERYNMLAMTAAHKTLPLPTYVEVTNLKNQRKVIVKVNDRGPFSGNRLIDLSYVAAKKLGMLGHGTTLVRVKAIDPYQYQYGEPLPRPKPLMVAAKRQKGIYLQVGAFKNKDNALRLKKRLSDMFSEPIVIFTSLNSQLYRVQLGPIMNAHIADQLMNRLQAIGFEPNKI